MCYDLITYSKYVTQLEDQVNKSFWVRRLLEDSCSNNSFLIVASVLSGLIKKDKTQ